MPTAPVYTLGYARWTIEEVEQKIEMLDATLVDIRYAPYTSKPGFSREALSSRFGFRYEYVHAFGNENYRGGPVKLVDPEQGLTHTRALDAPLVFLCGCQHPETCHRSTVATLIVEHEGGSVYHLRPPAEKAQKSLFEDDDS